MSVQDLASGTTSASGTMLGRRRLLTTTIPNNQIANPALCLEIDEMILFNILINDTDRSQSHYPVYVKNSMYASKFNSFDYGPFTELENKILTTSLNISSFAFVFTTAGVYVFQDASNAAR